MHEEGQKSLRTFFGCFHCFVNALQVFFNPLNLVVYVFGECFDFFGFAVALSCRF